MTQTAPQPSKLDVEAIVRLVVERVLRESPRNEHGSATSDTGPQDSDVSSPNRLRLETKLLTLEVIRGQLDGISIVEVASKTIVTPAVKDELRDRNIQLEFLSADVARKATLTKKKTKLLSETDSACQSASETIARICNLAKHEPWGPATCGQIVQTHKQDSSCRWIVSTKEPLQVVWNLQQGGVKAAICRTGSDVKDAASQFAASVLVIDGRCGLSGELVEEIKNDFCQ